MAARLKAGMKVLIVALFVLAAVIALFAARLALGPVPIAGLTPQIEKALAGRLPGGRVKIDNPLLAWNATRPGFDILLSQARIARAGTTIALDDIRLGVDPLLRLRRIEIGRLGGKASLRPPAGWPAPVVTGGLPRESGTLRLPPAATAWIDALARSAPHRLAVRSAALTLLDEGGTPVLALHKGRITASRTSGRLVVQAEFAAGTAAGASLAATLVRQGEKQMLFRMRGIVPAELARAGLLPAGFAATRLPLDLDLTADADADGTILRAGLALDAGAGSIAWGPYYPDPVALDGARLALAYDNSARRIEVRELALEFAGNSLRLVGRLGPEGAGEMALRLCGGFGPLAVPDLVRYWPLGLAAGARDWIAANIEAGLIDHAAVALELPSWPGPDDPFPADGLRLDFRFSGLVGHYLRPMPPLVGASGSGHLSAAELQLGFANGTISGLPVAGSEVLLAGFDRPGVDTGVIDIRLDGALPQVLRLIDSPPLGYATAFGIAPDSVAGKAAAEARITLPLLRDAQLADVELGLEAAIEELSIPDLLAGHGLSKGQLRLVVDNAGLSATGPAQIAGIPVTLSWHERFDASEGPSSRYRVGADLTPDALESLGIDAAGILEGVATLDLRLAGNGTRLEDGALKLDLGSALLTVPALNWEKPLGRPATLHAALDFRDPHRIRVHRLGLAAGDDRLAGAFELDAGSGALLAAALDPLRLGETSGALQFARRGDGGLQIAFTGPTLDARGLLAEVDFGAAGKGGAADSLSLSLHADRVLVLGGEVFEDLELAAERSPARWRHAQLSAGIAGDGHLAMSLAPDDAADEAGGRRFRLVAADAGRAFRGLGIFDQAEGGELTVEARLEGEGPGVAIDGLATLEDVRVVKSGSIHVAGDPEARSRLDSYIGDAGLHFDRMELPFVVRNEIIDIENARASGAKLGLTLEGQLDAGFRQVNVNGLIVPAYSLNSALGKLPLVGGLFSGGEGGGLFSFAYRIKGRLDDPKISVSTMTGVLPGILRRPFTGSKGQIEKPVAPSPDEAPQEPPGG
ncbi:MAG: AsmA-like C-terminal domain-containing protein [Rhodothalassiaceae bacterium]